MKKLKNKMSRWFNLQKIYYFYTPIFIGSFVGHGFLQIFNEKFSSSSAEAPVFFWNTILLSLVVGTLMTNLKTDMRTNEGIDFQQIGYLIVISGMLILLGTGLQGLTIKYPSLSIIRNLPIAGVSFVVLFIGITMFLFEVMARYFKTLQS